MTYPTMFMGIGNLTLMPLAVAIGRRPVYLFSCVLMTAAAIGAAYVKNYNQHLGVGYREQMPRSSMLMSCRSVWCSAWRQDRAKPWYP